MGIRAPKLTVWTVASLWALVACGGEEPKGQAAEPAATDSGGEEVVARDPANEPQIEGLMGTLPQFAIQSALNPRMPRFARCFADRSGDVEMLGGRIELVFRIDVDGSVKWVYPKDSTIGDRETERCILEVAGNITFRKPSGGEAEFTWPLEYDPPDDVRPAVSWHAAEVSEAVSDHAAKVSDECGPQERAVVVTAYVAPGGTVMAAGASAADPEMLEKLDCVTEHVKSWDLPDPGSYPAKVTFSVGGPDAVEE